jgi:hypothetical protein
VSADVQSFISKELHSLLFFEEFVFSRNKFTPPSSTEVEFADAIVMLGNVLLIYQIKERLTDQAGDAEAERRWFKSKVLGKATKQVRDTLRFLRTCSEIRVPNERGHVFNLAAKDASVDLVKIVIYKPTPNLPNDCRRVRHHVSDTAGFIHIIEVHDYLEMSRTLRVPEDLVCYLKYREMVLTKSEDKCLFEPGISGHFIGGDTNILPTVASARYLKRLVQDEEEWDLSPFLRDLYNHLSDPKDSDKYYDILIEFVKLPRSVWRAVKERVRLCVENVNKDEFAQPYRIVAPHTGCGFVFIPVPSELVLRPDWPIIRERAIEQFTLAHKYDQRLSKCIGVLFAKQGSAFYIDWCLEAYEWVEDRDIQRALDKNFPFRRVRVAMLYGYLFEE